MKPPEHDHDWQTIFLGINFYPFAVNYAWSGYLNICSLIMFSCCVILKTSNFDFDSIKIYVTPISSLNMKSDQSGLGLLYDKATMVPYLLTCKQCWFAIDRFTLLSSDLMMLRGLHLWVLLRRFLQGSWYKFYLLPWTLNLQLGDLNWNVSWSELGF